MADFANEYLSHFFPLEFGEHHEDLFDLIQGARRRKRDVRAEPREHGKSTVAIVLAPLYWLAYRLKHFIVLFGSSDSAIGPHYSSLQEQLDPVTGNARLLADFPHLRPAIDFKGQFVAWTDHKMRLVSGATVSCWGIFSKYRGMKEGTHRPDAIIIDDPQDEDDVSTWERRQKLLRRFRKTIINLGSADCDILVEGNLMHKESLIAELLKDPVWNGKLYRARNMPPEQDEEFPIGNTKEDGTPLWPAMWTEERLIEKEAEIKPGAFAIEFLNKDRADEERIYDASLFQRFDLEELEFDDTFECVLVWDPSDPKKVGQSDFPSLTVGMTKKIKLKDRVLRYYWVVDNFLKQVPAEEQVERCLDFHERWPITRLYYEDNGGFGTLLPFLRVRAKERHVHIAIRRIHQTKNKVQRIAGAQAVVMNRTFFNRKLSALYFSQWTDFPTGAHDDGPDSTVSLFEIFEERRKGTVGTTAPTTA